MKQYRNNYAVWLMTGDLMTKLRLPFSDAHRRAQAIVALDELKEAMRRDRPPSIFSK